MLVNVFALSIGLSSLHWARRDQVSGQNLSGSDDRALSTRIEGCACSRGRQISESRLGRKLFQSLLVCHSAGQWQQSARRRRRRGVSGGGKIGAAGLPAEPAALGLGG
jgi:hypothetical protein